MYQPQITMETALILNAASMAFSQLFSPGFRSTLWKSLGLTIAMLFGLWLVIDFGLTAFVLPMVGLQSWLATILSWIFGAGMIIGMGFLIAPVTSIFGGFFIDEIAEEVETKHYPADPPGQPLPTARAALLSLKFTILVISTNLLALLLLLVPGINLMIFFIANGYLLGREYFQFAALRFMDNRDANRLRHQNRGTVFAAGLVIAGFLSIPLLNLLTPMFAAALMVHIFKKVERR